MIEKFKRLCIIGVCGGIFAFLADPKVRAPVENLDIEVITGIDIAFAKERQVVYETVRETYLFLENNKRTSKIAVAKGESSGATREVRQLKTSKEKIIGLVKVDLLSEDFARFGILTAIEIHFKDPGVNDTAKFIVCKGDIKTLMEYKPPGYTSCGDFIEGLIDNNIGMNFFSSEYTARNMYVRMDSEGRNIKMPYIELTKDGIEIAGVALFNKDKMVAVADIKNARIMNMMLYNDAKGIVTLFNGDGGFIDFDATSNRKIKCYKVGDKYNFVIALKLKGDIITNTMDKETMNSVSNQREFEKSMAESVEKQCYEFIRKMKNEYKVDCLELGRVAAATYGRRKGIDWNEVVMNSNIEVTVDVKLDKQGRGNY